MNALKRVVITGGKGCLGQAIAESFCAASWDVCAVGRNDLDVCDEESVRRYFENTDCDLLICCAGMVNDKILLRMDAADWDEILRVNYLGARLCAKSAIQGMVRKGNGHVVFLSSYGALYPEAGQAAYATAKAALVGLTRDLAMRYGGAGIRVNVILPGFLETKMIRDLSQKRIDEVRQMHQLGAFNDVERVARFVRFLEEEMIFTSGQVFQLDSRLGC